MKYPYSLYTKKVNILKILLHESLSLDLISYLDINWKYTVIEIKHVALTTGHFFFFNYNFWSFLACFFYMYSISFTLLFSLLFKIIKMSVKVTIQLKTREQVKVLKKNGHEIWFKFFLN